MANAPPRLSIVQIADHAHRCRTDRSPLETDLPIDFTKPFVCPSLTALYYTPFWSKLEPTDQLRYTQLSALSFNELIAWFERGFSSTLRALMRSDRLPEELKSLLPGFLEDECRHQEIWWTLNRRVDPVRYSRNIASISKIAPAGRALMSWLASRPLDYPVVIWLMLVLEEHGNEIARRCAARRPDEIEPHFAAAYLAHVRDEIRHVQIDWHLLDSLWPSLRGWRRRMNIELFRLVIARLLFKTEHASMSVVEELVRERPRLRLLLPQLRTQLREVSQDREFRSMMLSARSTPIVFHLLDLFPELESVIA
ncbi:MAG TPA: diiron oxygenase [Terriglobales bacterium]|nr:diiron oxygenase [Terriglobales bacterium]